MKDLLFLFDNFQLFLILYTLVLLDAVIAIFQAILTKRLDWSYLPSFLNKFLKYTVLLMSGNIVEYVSTFSGYNLNELGIMTVFLGLFASELGSVKTKLLPEKTTNL